MRRPTENLVSARQSVAPTLYTGHKHNWPLGLESKLRVLRTSKKKSDESQTNLYLGLVTLGSLIATVKCSRQGVMN